MRLFKHHIYVSARSLRKRPGYALLNTLGLGLGLACALVIALFCRDEWRVDRHHPNAERLYRLLAEEVHSGVTTFHEGVAGGMARALIDDFPEVEQAARVINPTYLTTWVYHEDTGATQQFCVADPAILELFDLPLVAGDAATALRAPDAVLITETVARQYFGAADPLGQTLRVEGFWGGEYVVTGVLRDIPAQSTIRFGILSGRVPTTFDSWETTDWRPVHTYLRLAPGTPPGSLGQKFPAWITRHADAEAASETTYHLQPMARVYLYSAEDYGLGGYGDVNTLRILSLIGVFILVIAAVNFINLTTAQATRRAKEVGVRKVVGASRRQLMGQFLGESLLLTILSTLFALILILPALPLLNGFTGKTLGLFDADATPVLTAFLVCSLIVGLAAGAYPAFILSAFRPGAVLKGTPAGRSGGGRLRRALVVFQFSLTGVLLICAGTVYLQWKHLTGQRWGFNNDEVVVLPIIAVDPAPMWSENWLGWRLDALKQAFLGHPGVLSASVSHVTPPLSITTALRAEGESAPRQMQYIYADEDFLDTYEIELLEGRNFDRKLLSDTALTDILLNETAVRQLGWDDPVGKRLVWESMGVTFTVTGVIGDFLNADLGRPIQPFFLMQMSQPPQFLSLRLRMDRLPETLAFLEATWKAFVPARPFEFEFADANIERLYRDDVRLGQVVGGFAGLAVVVACLGLFGLAAYTARRRSREFGIRKVFGATWLGIARLLSYSFAKLVLLANLIAWPVGYFAARRWLEGFAFRAELGAGIFLATGLVTMLVAMVAVGYQALRAAVARPIEILREE